MYRILPLYDMILLINYKSSDCSGKPDIKNGNSPEVFVPSESKVDPDHCYPVTGFLHWTIWRFIRENSLSLRVPGKHDSVTLSYSGKNCTGDVVSAEVAYGSYGHYDCSIKGPVCDLYSNTKTVCGDAAGYPEPFWRSQRVHKGTTLRIALAQFRL